MEDIGDEETEIMTAEWMSELPGVCGEEDLSWSETECDFNYDDWMSNFDMS